MVSRTFRDLLSFIERAGDWAARRKRLHRLSGTCAASLETGHIDSLELLDLAASRGVQAHTIFDIGANVGTWSRLAHAIFPAASIHAFEPLDAHLSLLRETAREIPQLEIHPVALGARGGHADIHVTSFSDASSLLPLTPKASSDWKIEETGMVSVPMCRLDDYITTEKLAYPDLLKLDVQGYETEVLTGSPETLKQAQAIICEISFQEFYEDQKPLHVLLEMLDQHGFSIRGFGRGIRPGLPTAQIDVMFGKDC